MTTFEGMTEEDQLSTLMAELKDSNIRQSVMEYIANKSEVSGVSDKQRLSKMIETIAAESVTNQKQSALWKSRTKKSILLGIAAVIVAITVQFLVNFFSNELSKESHVSGKGTMVGTDGSVVKTEMNEMRVNADGQLQGRSSVKTIKTTPSLNQIALASSLPDSTLLALDEVTVYSDKGHTLRLKIMGFARVPVMNSRCGNLVHFYSANGRLSLDSTDISFDQETESQFKDAGFSLAVGGYGGRRLAGTTSAQGFFKHVDKLRTSGSWTCADVPLPAVQKNYMSRTSEYEPCIGHGCYSNYGGLKLGVAKIAEAHALAALPVTSRIRSLLKGSATEAYYQKTEQVTLSSESYTLGIETWPMHFGQEKIRLLSHASSEEATFQSEIGAKNIYHCKSSKEAAYKTWVNAMSSEGDAALKLEFVGLTEEGGKVLRHWRWWFSDKVLKTVGQAKEDDSEKGGLGEFWDFADTLVPYRALSTRGFVSVYESYSAKCTDADVSEALSLRSSASVKELLGCKVQTVLEWPQMQRAMDDLSGADIPHYMSEIFGGMDGARKIALAEDGEMSALADYLTRGEQGFTKGSVPDHCYLACKDSIDAHAQKYECKANLAAKTCLEGSFKECRDSPWMGKFELACMENKPNSMDRSLEESHSETESVLVPAHPAGVADLSRASPSFQAALAKTRTSGPKIVLNVTRKLQGKGSKRRRLAGAPGTAKEGGNCPGKPTSGKITGEGKKHQLSKCPSCKWGSCMFQYKTLGIEGLVQGLGKFMCFSFSFCFSPNFEIAVMFKWDIISNFFCFSLILSSCVTVQMYALPDPPFVLEICVMGELHVNFQHDCPNVAPIHFSGSGTLTCDIYFRLGIFGCSVREKFCGLTLKVEVGLTSKKWEVHCWNEESRRRRRSWWDWTWRRRYDRRCNYEENCDEWQKILLEYTFLAIWRIWFEDLKWTKLDVRIGKLGIKIKWAKNGVNIFDIGWWPMFEFECYRKASQDFTDRHSTGFTSTSAAQDAADAAEKARIDELNRLAAIAAKKRIDDDVVWKREFFEWYWECDDEGWWRKNWWNNEGYCYVPWWEGDGGGYLDDYNGPYWERSDFLPTPAPIPRPYVPPGQGSSMRGVVAKEDWYYDYEFEEDGHWVPPWRAPYVAPTPPPWRAPYWAPYWGPEDPWWWEW